MTRRGHVYRRKTKTGAWSRWYAVIDTEKESDGRRRQVTRAFDTRAQAYAWLAEQQLAAQVGGPTVAVWLRDWLASRADLRASTLATYIGHIDNHLVPLLGGQLLRSLSSGARRRCTSNSRPPGFPRSRHAGSTPRCPRR